MSMDTLNKRLNFFQKLSQFFTTSDISLYNLFKGYPFIGAYATNIMIQKVEFITSATFTLISLSEEAVDHFRSSFRILKPEAVNAVLEEVGESTEAATHYLYDLESTYASALQASHTKRATNIMLKRVEDFFEDVRKEGLIGMGDVKVVEDQLDEKMVEVRNQNFKLKAPNPGGSLLGCPLLSDLEPAKIAEIRLKSKIVPFKSTNLDSLRKFDDLYILTEGIVREKFPHFTLMRGVGMPLNPYDFVYGLSVQCTFSASNNAKVMVLSSDLLKELLNTH